MGDLPVAERAAQEVLSLRRFISEMMRGAD